ncbi:sporulation inhibitor of replication protein SirA [Radiobacillus sp. PE A8.2]|uniref:sporulation inhibitor of replication protein SirA n=1 Tax=Radiobacillus sp. PE A8.2 TaxID=3380349 RepID=UPI003890BB78
MHKYAMFWIKEEFCYQYYYKSDVLHRFLNQCLTNRSIVLDTQFNYVTQPISFTQLLKHIKNFHLHIKIDQDGNTMTLKKHGQSLCIHIEERYLMIDCNTVQEADNLLFQPLISFHRNFFIIEKGTINNGWIAPAKKEMIL